MAQGEEEGDLSRSGLLFDGVLIRVRERVRLVHSDVQVEHDAERSVFYILNFL